jgi:cytochrome c oxidase subunit IV
MDTSEDLRRTEPAAEPRAEAHEPGGTAHPGPKQYIVIAVVLAVATSMEVGLYYMTSLPRPLYISLLMTFMVFKFALVVLWFMHLRFDSRIFRRLFVTGILLAITVYLVVLFTFGVFTRS